MYSSTQSDKLPLFSGPDIREPLDSNIDRQVFIIPNFIHIQSLNQKHRLVHTNPK